MKELWTKSVGNSLTGLIQRGGDNMFISDPYKNKATHAQLWKLLTKDSFLYLGASMPDW